jgi:hypothetical protein
LIISETDIHGVFIVDYKATKNVYISQI